MAHVEGAVRMKRLGKTIILCGLASTVLGVITLLSSALIGQHSQSYHSPILFPTSLLALAWLTYLGILPMIVGGSLWAGGWIVEGFLDPRRPE
jgi:hypothetical protein